MAGSVNKVILVGNLGRDPEIRTFQNGGRVCNLSVATSENWKDRNSGERREKTEWHRVVVTNENLIGVCERYLRKGSKVYLEGQLETRKFTDQNGQERYTTEVVLRPYRGELTMLDSRQDAGGGGGYDSSHDYGGDHGGGSRGSAPAGRSGSYGGSGGGGGSGSGGPSGSGGGDLDDEIPF